MEIRKGKLEGNDPKSFWDGIGTKILRGSLICNRMGIGKVREGHDLSKFVAKKNAKTIYHRYDSKNYTYYGKRDYGEFIE